MLGDGFDISTANALDAMTSRKRKASSALITARVVNIEIPHL